MSLLLVNFLKHLKKFSVVKSEHSSKFIVLKQMNELTEPFVSMHFLYCKMDQKGPYQFLEKVYNIYLHDQKVEKPSLAQQILLLT